MWILWDIMPTVVIIYEKCDCGKCGGRSNTTIHELYGSKGGEKEELLPASHTTRNTFNKNICEILFETF